LRLDDVAPELISDSDVISFPVLGKEILLSSSKVDFMDILSSAGQFKHTGEVFIHSVLSREGYICYAKNDNSHRPVLGMLVQEKWWFVM